MTDFTDEVVGLCLRELQLFRNGHHKEYDLEVYRRVGDYWNAVADVPDYRHWRGYHGRSDCRLVLNSDNDVVQLLSNDNQPWSAAFISWVARTAGAADGFHYGPSHSVYIVKALKAASTAGTTEKFVARRHTEYTPKVGDLIACERRSSDDANFDTYPSFVASGRHEAHCDFVVGFVDNGRTAVTVGGNVSNSVMQKDWPLDANGRIGNHDPRSTTAKPICIIECLL